MIEVSNLSKRYGNFYALDDVNFTINDGEVIGFLGPNGAGKTTTMNILTGYLSSTSGTVQISGHSILDEPNEAKKCIGYLPEQPPLYLEMTVREYLSFIYDLKKIKLPKSAHIEEICRLVKIDDVFDRLIRNLSKGYRQRVGLAQALIGNPEVLILDEPTVGLDPKQIIEIRKLISELGKAHTIIFSSHILSEIQSVCNRIIVINNGKIVADDTTENLISIMSNDNHLVVRIAGPRDEAKRLIHGIRGVVKVETLGGQESHSCDFHIEAEPDIDIRRELFNRLADRGWAILLLKNRELSLEEIFLTLTESNNNAYRDRRVEKKEKRDAKKASKDSGIDEKPEETEIEEITETTGTADEPQSEEKGDNEQ